MNHTIAVGLAVLVIAVVLLAYAFSIAWAFQDARRRRKSGVLVALLVAFLSWPIGLVAWLVFRPSLPSGVR
jgi:multisubunit Na+/H+ antiporter MnhB subunit